MREAVPVLIYHSVSHCARPRFARFVVAPESFAQQLRYLATHGFTPLTVSQYVNARANPTTALPWRPVVLTFDDGFADFAAYALPALIRHSFVATLYVATAHIGGTSQWLQHEGEMERAMLTWEQLTVATAYGIECGAHTHTHPQLDTLSRTAANDEIVRPRRLLAERLGQQAVSFAYPFGYYNRTVQRLVRDAGYTSACAVNYAFSAPTDCLFAIPRLIVTPDMTLDAFARLVSGEHMGRPRSLVRAQAFVWRSARRVGATWKRSLHHEEALA